MFLYQRRLAVFAWLVCVPLCGANALEAPKSKVVLTVSGTLTKPNHGKDATFSMEMLEKLPQQTFTTKTPWYPQAVTFTGPLLRDVLAAAGASASGKQITARALDDYKTLIPMSDVQNFNVILARQIDGKSLSIREKGPLFIVFPYDSKPELQGQVYLDRSAWQLKSLTID
jgi:hypothetical protein